jgi:hypothetical protein
MILHFVIVFKVMINLKGEEEFYFIFVVVVVVIIHTIK